MTEYEAIRAEIAGARLDTDGLRWIPRRARRTPGRLGWSALAALALTAAALAWALAR